MERTIPTTSPPSQEDVIATLRAQIAALSRDNEALAADNARLAADAARSAAGLAEASARLEEAASRIEGLEAKLARLVEQTRLANVRYFGSRSEKVIPEQLSLFNDVEAAAVPDAAEPALEEALAQRKPRRRGGKRRVDTSKLERVVVEHKVEDPRCPACGRAMEEMNVEVTEVVRLVPAHLVVEEHRRHVYRCKPCCEANAAGGEAAARIVRAPMPKLTPVPGSFATASLVASVINSKYSLSTPLYRIEEEFRQLGVDVSRQTMSNWVLNVHARWLSKVHARMKEKLLECRHVNADETEVQVLKEPGREAKRKSYMWLFRSGPREVPICVYEYHPTRSGSVPRAFLSGWSGYLTTDGYGPYFDLGIDGVVNTACLVHVRRKFAEIVKAAGGDAVCEGADSVALEARRRVDAMFRVDARFDGMASEERKEARLAELAPLMDSFEEWARGQVGRAAPRLALHAALSYALKYWPHVRNVLLDGDLDLDNNVAERAIKPFVIGRKNWLFSDTPRGAEASAAIYSIVVTAKLNGLNQRAYVEWLLTEMPDDERLGEPGRIDRYLPWSGEVPDACRLSPEKAKEAAEMPDEPIVDAAVIEAARGLLQESSQGRPGGLRDGSGATPENPRSRPGADEENPERIPTVLSGFSWLRGGFDAYKEVAPGAGGRQARTRPGVGQPTEKREAPEHGRSGASFVMWPC